MTFSQRAVEAAAAHVLRELDDRGLLKGVDDDLFSEIGNDVAKAALTAALAVDGLALQGWQPIESAPKDGRDVLCYAAGIGMGQMVLYWTDGYWREKANGMGLKTNPVAWMPLPPPPAASDREERRPPPKEKP